MRSPRPSEGSLGETRRWRRRDKMANVEARGSLVAGISALYPAGCGGGFSIAPLGKVVVAASDGDQFGPHNAIPTSAVESKVKIVQSHFNSHKVVAIMMKRRKRRSEELIYEMSLTKKSMETASIRMSKDLWVKLMILQTEERPLPETTMTCLKMSYKESLTVPEYHEDEYWSRASNSRVQSQVEK